MKIFKLFAILVLLPVLNWAQSNKKVEDHQFTINVLLPGVVYEHGISQNSTVTAEATMGFAYRESDFLNRVLGFIPLENCNTAITTIFSAGWTKESTSLGTLVTILHQR